MTKFFQTLHNYSKNSKLNIKNDKTYFKNSNSNNSKNNRLEGPKNNICESETDLYDKIL